MKKDKQEKYHLIIETDESWTKKKLLKVKELCMLFKTYKVLKQIEIKELYNSFFTVDITKDLK